jgi:hypothetical protein
LRSPMKRFLVLTSEVQAYVRWLKPRPALLYAMLPIGEQYDVPQKQPACEVIASLDRLLPFFGQNLIQ